MKNWIIIIGVFFTNILMGQQFEDQMNKAGESLQKKDYCGALKVFKEAFKDSSKIGTYELAYGAVAAANCGAEDLAISWLLKSQKKGLGLNPGEMEALVADSNFLKLHSLPGWNTFVENMKMAFIQKQEFEANQAKIWKKQTIENRIEPAANGKYAKPKGNFAIYESKVSDLSVPFGVYVPTNYDPAKSSATFVYLHGGVVNIENFETENPSLITGEPIFSVADELDAIVVYPFAKKDFGWVSQKLAFQNVLKVVDEVQKRYNVDKSKIFLGGMSNGGSATFWFASQKNSAFKGFYAFSTNPKLEIENIAFENMSSGRPFYCLNAKDDGVFKYEEVKNIYDANKLKAKDWNFEFLEKGDHGFIYDPNGGKNLVKEVLTKLLKQ